MTVGRVLLTFILISGSAAFADGKGAQAGLMWGYSVPDAANTNQYKLFGVKGEAFFLPNFSAGGYYLLSDKSGDPSTTEKFRYSLHGVQAALHMNASGGDTFVALRMGLSKVKSTVNTEDLVFSPYHYGIATGYDYFIGTMFSLGFEGSYLHVQRGRTTDSSGASVNLDSFNIISFIGTAQLRF
jgi:hypothetical protein